MVVRLPFWMRSSVTAMRLNRLLPLAAAVFVTACNPQAADRPGSARAPIPAAEVPASQAASAACPQAPAPACTPPKVAAGGAPAPQGTRVAARHKTVVRKAAARQPRRAYRRYEALAGGPAPHSEYARVPQREYARVPQDDYADGPATSYRYGPAYPPAARPDEYGYDRYERSRREGGARGWEDRYDGRRALREPSPEDRYGPGRPFRQEDGPAYGGRYGARRHEGELRRPPRFDRRLYEERGYEGRYESRSESSSTYESYGARFEGGPCCRTEAAGFDVNGFLTWPGKVPARP
jgi:hypothetical protein